MYQPYFTALEMTEPCGSSHYINPSGRPLVPELHLGLKPWTVRAQLPGGFITYFHRGRSQGLSYVRTERGASLGLNPFIQATSCRTFANPPDFLA